MVRKVVCFRPGLFPCSLLSFKGVLKYPGSWESCHDAASPVTGTGHAGERGGRPQALVGLWWEEEWAVLWFTPGQKQDCWWKCGGRGWHPARRTFQHSGLISLGSIHLLERGEDGEVQGRLEPVSPVGWEVDAAGVRDSALLECSVPVAGPLVAVCWPGEGREAGAGGRGRGWHGAERTGSTHVRHTCPHPNFSGRPLSVKEGPHGAVRVRQGRMWEATL